MAFFPESSYIVSMTAHRRPFDPVFCSVGSNREVFPEVSDLSNPVFKTTKPSPSAKADITTAAARSIIDDEVTAREKKTARLQLLRMEKEAAEAKEPAPAKPKKAAKKIKV
ncbi:hypothetical protein [Aliihoeflea sp. 40Bstr573]|uniref:hypothetical protein n=1 Tax=Aliihoeflea sp. 40Bstr573 TaxID=2696467 RepID=UPI002094BE5A|nr:hypothetical protein [Aliihoeflea sp. 40Bstr573]